MKYLRNVVNKLGFLSKRMNELEGVMFSLGRATGTAFQQTKFVINELAMIFKRMNIDTQEVLEAAGTKWNFLPFTPGLVGGHCIGVDPYYLTHRAEIAGYRPEVILAGRRINDEMGPFIARETVRRLAKKGGTKSFRVSILGLALFPLHNSIGKVSVQRGGENGFIRVANLAQGFLAKIIVVSSEFR